MTASSRAGFAFAVSAYVLWGTFPIYFHAVADMPPLEVLSYRVLVSLAITLTGILVIRDWAPLKALLQSRKRLLLLLGTVSMLSLNWLIFIWAIGAGHGIESGLGYYICPLLSVLLAALILGERLGVGQLVGIACVAIGVLWQILAVGQVPWIALSLAITWGLYGLCRKVVALPAMAGLFAETLVLAPFVLCYVIWQESAGIGHFIHGDMHHRVLLLLAGPCTAAPLLLFALATNRLSLQTVGLLQYFNPTMQLCIAIFLFREPMPDGQIITFSLIWLGLALYYLLPRLRRRPQLATEGN